MFVPILKTEPDGGVTVTFVKAQLSVAFVAKLTTALLTQAPATFVTMSLGQDIIGFSLSVTVTVKLQVLVFPLVSVTTNVFVVMPAGKAEPLACPRT